MFVYIEDGNEGGIGGCYILARLWLGRLCEFSNRFLGIHSSRRPAAGLFFHGRG